MSNCTDSKPVVTTYSVFVDYDKSVEEMVELGPYDRINKGITSKHFPTKRTGKTEIVIELVRFCRHRITDQEVLMEFYRMGYRPAELHELLAFGEKYPKVQCEVQIIALGSVWRRKLSNSVPYLGMSDSKRILGLHWAGCDWYDFCRFAAVRK